jgi:prepilin-type N-terminal cleavage/methylation domain-containing protein/prepilin-type processing-associated H-X9-DG protein
MRQRKAFTLIELLVVIAIIGMLLAVLVPGLKKAKDLGKRAVCLAHLHSLGLSWGLYANEYDARIVCAKTARVFEQPGPSGGTQYRLDYLSDPYFEGYWTWAGWLDQSTPDTPEAHKACITLGALFPYTETIKVYRCPEGMKDQWRTYAIVDSMNGHHFGPPGGPPLAPVIRKTSEIVSPGARMVFIDEGYASTESWTIYWDRVSWWDRIPLRHGEGTCLAFADGHAEYWKWEDSRTVYFAKIEDPTEYITAQTQTAQNNPDFDRVQRAVWTLKYRK